MTQQNDADRDKICGDIDSCPKDKENDADSDRCYALMKISVNSTRKMMLTMITSVVILILVPYDSANDLDSDMHLW